MIPTEVWRLVFVSWIPLAAVQAQIVNGDFEEDWYPAAPITGWTGSGGLGGQPVGSPVDPRTGMPYATVIASSGSCSGLIGSGRDLHQSFGVEPDRDYTVHFTSKAMVGLPKAGRLRVRLLDRGGTPLAEVEPALDLGGGGEQGFKPFSLPFHVPLTEVRLTLVFTNIQSADSYVAFDEVRLSSPVKSSTPSLDPPPSPGLGRTWRVSWTEPSIGYHLEYADRLAGPWTPPPQIGLSPVPGLRREGDRLYFIVSPPPDKPIALFRLVPDPQ